MTHNSSPNWIWWSGGNITVTVVAVGTRGGDSVGGGVRLSGGTANDKIQ